MASITQCTHNTRWRKGNTPTLLVGTQTGAAAMENLMDVPQKLKRALSYDLGVPGGSVGKESACNVGDLGSIPGLGRSPGEGNSYPLLFWPGEFHGLYSPWGRKESDTTERLLLYNV